MNEQDLPEQRRPSGEGAEPAAVWGVEPAAQSDRRRAVSQLEPLAPVGGGPDLCARWREAFRAVRPRLTVRRPQAASTFPASRRGKAALAPPTGENTWCRLFRGRCRFFFFFGSTCDSDELLWGH